MSLGLLPLVLKIRDNVEPPNAYLSASWHRLYELNVRIVRTLFENHSFQALNVIVQKISDVGEIGTLIARQIEPYTKILKNY